MASISQLTARLVDLFGTPSTANPAKLLGNLGVSPAGNVLVGSGTDNGTDKLQVTGTTKLAGATTNSGGGFIQTAQDAGGGQFRITQNNYGSFFRNDGTTCYLLSTASGNQLGTYSAYRPFAWNMTNGTVTIAGDGSAISMGSRPTMGGNLAWDAGNFNPANYVTTGGLAYTSSHLRASGNDTTWNWSGQGGQPTWLWGGGDGVNMYVYNPSNFSVNYANSAGSVGGVTRPAVAGSNAFRFDWDGSAGNVNITVDSTFVAYIHQNTSDVRIKENIVPIEQDSLALIDQTAFVSYDYKKDGGHISAGVIAQEVEQYAPQWVSQHDNGDGIEDMRFMKHHEMLMTALHAIQQLNSEVKTLKALLKEKE